jgi:hypothetical protein
MTVERVRQAHVPGGDGIAALPLEMAKERHDGRGVQRSRDVRGAQRGSSEGHRWLVVPFAGLSVH